MMDGASMMKTTGTASAVLAVVAMVGCGFLFGYTTRAQGQDEMKDAVATFVFDLHDAMKRSSLTPDQKQQVRTDLQTLRTAQQTGDRRSGIRAMMSFRRILDSGAFQPQDTARLKQDLQNIRAAKKAGGGGMGMGGGGMGGGGMGGGGMGGGMP
jgi:uncharacterized membrane protein YgcG